MPTAPRYHLNVTDHRAKLVIEGDWTVHTLSAVQPELSHLEAADVQALEVDLTGVGRFDTAAAFLIDRFACVQGIDAIEVEGGSDGMRQLLTQAASLRPKPQEETPHEEPHGLVDLLERTGRTTSSLVNEVVDTLAFFGETLMSMFMALVRPTRMRWTALVAVMEDSGLDAVPIVAFLSFFVGMVIAFIGASTLSEFGATIFTVELVGIAVLREFGVVLTAVILAGRTNSAFTAQIGAMRMRQEVDAMTTLGLDPMDVLVVPRAFAMLIMTPVLTLVAMLFGIGGGAFVSWVALDINPTVFLNRIQEFVPIENFWVGMSKAPVFGMIVALVGCRQGLLVGGSVQSLGRSTTKSVVQALFSVIVIDALFAVFYMELGW
ncbi:ABC transporter permease [Henriciella mobilis]|uniref:ABC transporter permease n=1 Tax=Henriciella mobilis TaxID=2305467 RepID=UPI000E6714E1|nr:ABC transporter permease [Henriciella mobilis]RIJ14266.1 ABC transporter permease [Henriciella mobilis]RIJ19904.1 ABC transporter permease [Henriciella mobilis]